MANIAALLKEEIARLVRKQLKSETEALKKTSSRYRSEIAGLKRRIAVLEKQAKAPGRQARAAAGVAGAEGNPGRRLRFRADGLKKHRERLGLSAAELGALLGVSLQTIYNWEAGKTRPRPAQIEKIAGVRAMGKREMRTQLRAAVDTEG